MSFTPPHRTRIKFCGFTRAEDLAAAVSLGVDAIGLICVPASKRYLSAEEAAQLRRQLPPFVTAVLLLSNAADAVAARIIEAVNPDLIQFHGDESPDACAAFGRRYLKSVAVHSTADIHGAAARYPGAAALLLDTPSATGLGGTGRQFDWSQIPRDAGKPLILAGGLTPANVGQAVRMATPYAVDVSSGIEAAPGRKDHQKMKAFVEAVRQADAEHAR